MISKDWLKVANPQNGDVGWIKAEQLKKQPIIFTKQQIWLGNSTEKTRKDMDKNRQEMVKSMHKLQQEMRKNMQHMRKVFKEFDKSFDDSFADF